MMVEVGLLGFAIAAFMAGFIVGVAVGVRGIMWLLSDMMKDQ